MLFPGLNQQFELNGKLSMHQCSLLKTGHLCFLHTCIYTQLHHFVLAAVSELSSIAAPTVTFSPGKLWSVSM